MRLLPVRSLYLPPFSTVTVFAVCSLFFAGKSIAQQQGNNTQLISQANWLLGSWRHQTPKALFAEEWTKQNDSTYAGNSYTLVNKDTVSSETVQLVQRNGQLYYIPTVKKQNGGLPVSFTLKAATAGTLSFANPEHDFPQTISYQLINQDSLVATISGVSKGQSRSIPFPMRRVR